MGGAVEIVKINEEDHKFVLDEAALSQILSDEKIKDKPVCIISVAGAFRRGKSFLLNFFLRYLSREGKEGWMGEETGENSPLKGFHWRGGSKRDTTGILMWSQVFEAKTKSGHDVAVMLMDTQGAFDSDSTVKDCATVFALSAMISSVLVYNLTSNIQEDDLQHLQLFTDYGRLAIAADGGHTPFQRLQFLVRDWSYPYEADYGAEGGRKVLQERLEASHKQHPELRSLRRHIKTCFDSIDGFLLPHPGQKAVTNPTFDGKLRDIEPQFKKHLNDFVPLVLSGDNLHARKIAGQEILCKDLVCYFRAYVDIFSGDEMPEPRSVLEATGEANGLAALSEAKDKYVALMDAREKPYLDKKELEAEHERCKKACVEVFSSRKKMGGEELSRKYCERLEREVEEAYGKYKMMVEMEQKLFEKDARDLTNNLNDLELALEESIGKMRKAADRLDSVWFNCKVSQCVGAGISIVGGTLTAVGGILTMSLGAGLPVLLAGVSTAFVGATNNAITSSVEKSLNSVEVRAMKDALILDRQLAVKLETQLNGMRLQWGEDKLKTLPGQIIAAVSAKKGIPAVCAGLALLASSAADLGQTIAELIRNEGSEAGKILRGKANELEKALKGSKRR